MRVGIITHNYPKNPSESKDAGRFVYLFSRALRKTGLEVFVLCPDYGGRKVKSDLVSVTWFKTGVGIDKFGSWKTLSPFSLVKFFLLMYFGTRAAREFVVKNKIDFLLCFWNFPSGFFGLFCNKMLDIKYATWALGSDINYYAKLPIISQLTGFTLRNALISFGNSRDICNKINTKYKVNSIYLPTSTLEKSNHKSIKIGLNKKTFNFLYLGRLEKVKGADLIPIAAKMLSDRGIEFHINIIGEGKLFTEMKNFIYINKLKSKITLLGYIESRDVVNGYMKESDAIIVPSRSESFPLVLLEAVSNHLPMLVSDVGDMKDFVKKEKVGYFFIKENANDLAKEMEKMIKVGPEIKKANKGKFDSLYKKYELGNIISDFRKHIKLRYE